MKTSLKENQKPNYERIRESVIYAKKLAYKELQQKKIKYINPQAIAVASANIIRVPNNPNGSGKSTS